MSAVEIRHFAALDHVALLDADQLVRHIGARCRIAQMVDIDAGAAIDLGHLVVPA